MASAKQILQQVGEIWLGSDPLRQPEAADSPLAEDIRRAGRDRSMSEKIQRFDIPSKPTRIEMYRAFRTYLEKTLGEPLSKAWYADSPEERPELYADQPHLLKKGQPE